MAYRNDTYIGEAYEVIINNQKVTLYVYIPDNIKSGSTVKVNGSIYWNGAGGYSNNPAEYQPISDYYKGNENVDYIFISMDINRHYDGVTDEAIRQVIDQIQRERNITIDVNRVEGLSAGGDEVVKCTLNTLHTNPAASQQQMVLYDPYSDNGGFGYRLTDDDIKLMKQNDTTAFLIMPRNRGYNYRSGSTSEAAFVNTLAGNGIPTIIVDGNFVHGNTARRALYDGWTDYLNGYIDLEDINDEEGKYQISVPYVGSDGKVTWQVYTLADLKEAKADLKEAKLHPGKYDASDLKGLNYALDKLDDLRVELDADDLIRRAGSLLTAFSNSEMSPPTGDYSSTSVLIPDSYAALANVRDAYIRMCASAQKEINYAISAGEEYIKLEDDLKKNTEGLNTFMKDKIDDLRIPSVELEVEIDDPDLKKQENAPGGGILYGGGNSYGGETSSETSPIDNAAEETEEETETETDESKEVPVTPEDKPSNVTPSPLSNNVNNGGGHAPASSVQISDTISDNDEYVEPDMDITDDDVIDEEEVIVDNNEIDVNDAETTNSQVTPSYIPNKKRKSNSVVKTIGAITTAGAAVAAGVYGAKKYKEHQEDNDDDDDDDSSYHSFDKAPSSNDEI